MNTYEEEVTIRLRECDDETLLEKIRSGGLTEQAKEIAMQEIAARGISPTEIALPQDVAVKDFILPKQPRKAIGAYLLDAWQGQLKLWQAFWFGYLIWIACVFLGLLVAELLGAGRIVNVLALILLSTVWGVCIWRCAFNVKHRFWGYIARWQAVVLVVGSAVYLFP